MERRRREGAIAVEMESAALFAVARFRDAIVGQLLYAGDDLSGENWDDRGWTEHRAGRERLFWLAVDSVLAIEP